MQKEAHARLLINDQLVSAGCRLLDEGGDSATVHVEYKTEGNGSKTGFADYVLFDSSAFPIAVVEAKAPHKHPLAGKASMILDRNSGYGHPSRPARQ